MKHCFEKYRYSCIALFVMIVAFASEPVFADNFLVTNNSTADVPGSLTRAMIGANTSTSNLPHVVSFSTPMTISNISSPYGFVNPTIIDATTVPGYSGVPLVHLMGAPNSSTILSFTRHVDGFNYAIKGLEIAGQSSQIGLEIVATQVLIENNVINGCQVGIAVSPSCKDLTIRGNYIGTDATGKIVKSNQTGISIISFSSPERNILIGGMTAAERNIISGNTSIGIGLSGPQATCTTINGGVKVIGNYIGTDVTGKVSLGNGTGINISGFAASEIGGAGDGARNIISGNNKAGITIFASAMRDGFTGGTVIVNNYIGTDVSGTRSLSNETGIYMTQCASDLTIGGTSAEWRNVISGNLKDGIYMDAGLGIEDITVQANYIGTDFTGKAAVANGRHGIFIRGVTDRITIGGSTSGRGNLISGNAENGIFINADLKEFEQNLVGYADTKNIDVSGNLIGLTVAGNRALANRNGIVVQSGVKDVLIGGENSQGNIISGNTASGIVLMEGIKGIPSNMRVYGNHIGLDITGEIAIPNNDGIFILNIDSSSIGRQNMGNVIAGNTRHGVWIQDKYNYGLQVCYNKIGLSVSNKIVISNGYGILLETLVNEPQRPTPPSSAKALSYRIGSHLTNDGGNTISGHRLGGILVSGIKSSSAARRLLEIENNTIRHNIADNSILPEVKLLSCSSDFTVGGANPFSANTIAGPLVIENSDYGIVRKNTVGDHRGGIDLIEDSFNITIAENTVTNAITVSGDEISDGNRITQNKITAPGKPINLHYGTHKVGNDNIQPPVILKYSLETGIVSGTWPDYIHFTSTQGNKTNPLIELFSTNKEGNSALEFLGCTCVNADGTWQTTIKAEDSHKFIFATVTGPDFNDVIVIKSPPLDVPAISMASVVDCPLENQHCPVDITWLNTSEFSNVLSIACGQISLDNASEGCVAFEPTALKLNFVHFEEEIQHFSVVVDYGDGSTAVTIPDQTSVWGVYISHQYMKAGNYTVTADVRVDDPDHPGTLIRYACMTSPESRTIAVDNCVPCDGCLPSFSPSPGNKYIFTAWVKESAGGSINYEHVKVFLDFIGNGATLSDSLSAQGDIIESWQRMEKTVVIPPGTEQIAIRIRNTSSSSVFIDDVRMHPFNASMKSFVYDPNTFRLVAELDDNNYATFYEYDEEGGLVRVKKETERGVMTIKESRTNVAKQNK